VTSYQTAHQASPAELKEQLQAERRGDPFLVHRDADGCQRIIALPGGGDRLTLGRRPGNDVELGWDAKVSRVHAALERVGAAWTIDDEGLSSNGTYVNEQRLVSRRQLRDGDVLRLGTTLIRFRDPSADSAAVTDLDSGIAFTAPSESQRRVLLALCRPLAGSDHGHPATNPQIAEELYLSVGAVKTHLRALFERLGIPDAPQTQKRAMLARRAIELGLVSLRELR
jgi:DNA-binding CsgD family transcriptional regulator